MTLVELVVVLAIVGLVVAIAIPNLFRARVRATVLAQVKQVREAAMVARMRAIQAGRPTVLRIEGPGQLLAWVDDNQNGVVDATDSNETYDGGERAIGRWAFAEKVTVADDPEHPLRVLPGGGKGVVFLANGSACPQTGSAGAGIGAFRVSDVRDNRFQVQVQGGAGSVTELMWDGSAWKPQLRHWRY